MQKRSEWTNQFWQDIKEMGVLFQEWKVSVKSNIHQILI